MAFPITSSPTDLVEPGWSSLSGRVLEGGFELQELLEADDSTARFKVRVLGDRELNCVALLYQVAGTDADSQVERWQLIRQMRHPNISAPVGAGRLQQDRIEAQFVVVPRADESLDGVLSERPLTAEEAGEVLVSSAKALQALHVNGLVHGCLSPSRVLAVGNSIKLSADCVRSVNSPLPIRLPAAAYLAPESAEQNVTPAADVWSLGATLFEMLTQKSWTEERREETSALPEPFASIALRCLHLDPEGRATLAEVMALQSGEVKPAPRMRAATVEIPAALMVPEAVLQEADVAEVSIPQEEAEALAVDPYLFSPAADAMPGAEVFPMAAALELTVLADNKPTVLADNNMWQVSGEGKNPVPVTSHLSFDDALQARPVRRKSALDADEVDEPSTNLWLFGGVALLIVLVLIWILRPKSHPLPAAAAAAAAPAPNVVKPAASAAVKPLQVRGSNAWETRTLQPDGSAQKAVSGKGTDEGPAVWRVVAFTYSHKPDAEKKVQELNRKSRKLHAEVFSPSGSGSPFLVVVGGRMSKDDAAQERRRAISAGFPRDSYIQNYTH